MPVKTVLFGVSTTISLLSSPSSSCHPLLFLHIIALCLPPLSYFIALLTVTFESFIHLGFHFLLLHLPALSLSCQTGMSVSSLYLSVSFAVVLLFTRSSSLFNSTSYVCLVMFSVYRNCFSWASACLHLTIVIFLHSHLQSFRRCKHSFCT